MSLVIHKNTVEIDCAQQKTAHRLRDGLADFMRSRFYPQLEKLLDEFDTDSSVRQIETLKIVVEVKNPKQWKNEILHQSLAQIRLYLRQQPSTGTGAKSLNFWDNEIENQNSSPETTAEKTNNPDTISALISFLKTGYSVKYGKRGDFALSLEEIEFTTQAKLRILKALVSDLQAALRFTWSIPKHIAQEILGSNKAIPDGFSLEEKTFLEYLKSHFKLADNESGFKMKIQPGSLGREFKKIKEKKLIKDEASQLGTKNKEEVYYLGNAGLTLLHPFLQNLFTSLDYLEGDQIAFKTKPLQNRAVLLTQYLVNFEERFFENDLILNKVLCGVKITDAINTEVEFTYREKELCRELLVSAITHWKILRNTSPEGLQSSFLQRNAKLTKAADTWKLTVENSGIDVLLNHIPWGIGTIKTPWMKDYLTCNWNG